MLSISDYRFDSLIEEAKDSNALVTSKDGKKYEVKKINLRINGKTISLKFKRDISSNVLYPQKIKESNKKKVTKKENA